MYSYIALLCAMTPLLVTVDQTTTTTTPAPVAEYTSSTESPTVDPSVSPSAEPSVSPTHDPTKSGPPTASPTAEPSVSPTRDPTVSHHFVARGDKDNNAWAVTSPTYSCEADSNTESTDASPYPGNRIGLGCCNADGTKGYRKLPNCKKGITFEEAKAVCQAQEGLRLCTKQEMLDKLTKGEGCNFDRAYLWVSDSCIPDLEMQARNNEELQSPGHDTVEVGEEAAATKWYLVAALVTALALIGAVAIALRMCYVSRQKKAEQEKVEEDMIVEENVPVADFSVEMITEAPTQI